MPLPSGLRLNVNHIIVAWGFLYPFLKRRAAATATLVDDNLIETANRLFQSPEFLQLLEQVFNREKPVDALDLEAPPNVNRLDARNFAGNVQYLEGFIRDTCASLEDARDIQTTVPVKCEDAATVLHTVNQAKMQGQQIEPDRSSYIMERSAQGTQAMSSAGLGSPPSGTRQPDNYLTPAANLSPEQMAAMGARTPGSVGVSGVMHTGGYPGAPAQGYMSNQPTGFAQVQAEKMHLPDSVTGSQTVGASVNPDPNVYQQQSQPQGYAPADEMPGTVEVSQPSTAQNTEQAATLAGNPTPLSNLATQQVQGGVSAAQSALQQSMLSAGTVAPQIGQTQTPELQQAAQQAQQAEQARLQTEQARAEGKIEADIAGMTRQTYDSMSEQAKADYRAANENWEQQLREGEQERK